MQGTRSQALDHVRQKTRLDFFFPGNIHELFVENQRKGCSLHQFNIDILGEKTEEK